MYSFPIARLRKYRRIPQKLIQTACSSLCLKQLSDSETTKYCKKGHSYWITACIHYRGHEVIWGWETLRCIKMHLSTLQIDFFFFLLKAFISGFMLFSPNQKAYSSERQPTFLRSVCRFSNLFGLQDGKGPDQTFSVATFFRKCEFFFGC